MATLALGAAGPDKTTGTAAVAAPGPPRAAQPVSQEGTVIAVSADWLTARSADGYTQIYRVTPNTTVITNGGDQSATVVSHFTINDRVDIVGTLHGGTAVATAVADCTMGRGDGPPMDYADGQAG